MFYILFGGLMFVTLQNARQTGSICYFLFVLITILFLIAHFVFVFLTFHKDRPEQKALVSKSSESNSQGDATVINLTLKTSFCIDGVPRVACSGSDELSVGSAPMLTPALMVYSHKLQWLRQPPCLFFSLGDLQGRAMSVCLN